MGWAGRQTNNKKKQRRLCVLHHRCIAAGVRARIHLHQENANETDPKKECIMYAVPTSLSNSTGNCSNNLVIERFAMFTHNKYGTGVANASILCV